MSHLRNTHVWIAAVLLAVICFSYSDIVVSLVSDWGSDENASYGFAIPPLAAFVAWTRRKATRDLPVSPDWRGLVVTGIACLMLAVGKLGAEQFLMRASLVALLVGLVWTFWGLSRLQSLAFPLALLATMIPLPSLISSRIALPLQLLASDVAAGVVRLAGGTIYRDGNILHMPGFTVGVAEACSGLHSVMALGVVALLMGFTHCRSIGARLLLLVLAVPVAILVNVVRVTGLVFLGEAHEALAMGFYHSFSGWLVFAGSAVLLLLLAKGLHTVLEA